MSPAAPTPLNVVTLGNSVSFMILRAGGVASETGNFSDVLADELSAAGIANDVALEGRWFDFAHKGLRAYETRVRPHRPHVLILNYGLNESQPWLAPIWLINHLLKRESATTKIGKWYRAKIAERMWKLVRKTRRKIAGRIGMWTWQTTPHRFQAAMKRLIFVGRAEQDCLVLVLDINPPGSLLLHFLPKQDARHSYYQTLIDEVVDSFDDPQVKLVRSSDLCVELGLESSLPDGMHLSPAGHEALGKRLAQEILTWHASRYSTTPVKRPAARARRSAAS